MVRLRSNHERRPEHRRHRRAHRRSRPGGSAHGADGGPGADRHRACRHARASPSRPSARISRSSSTRGLVAVESQGRHRYFRLADRDVAHLLESLMGVAFRTGRRARRWRVRASRALAQGAGVLRPPRRRESACGIYESSCGQRALVRWRRRPRGLPLRRERLVPQGFHRHAITRRPEARFCRACLDWSERRHHLAGALGAALLARFIDLGWAKRARDSRVVLVTPTAERELRRLFESREVAPASARRGHASFCAHGSERRHDRRIEHERPSRAARRDARIPASPGKRTRAMPARGFDACAAATMWSICRLNAASPPNASGSSTCTNTVPPQPSGGSARPWPARPSGQRFDEQREAEALVAGVEAAERQQRALGLGEQRARIVGRVALVVDEPRARAASCPPSSAGSAKPMLVIELEMSIRIGSPDVGNPAAIGFGVMIGVRPPCGTTREHGRIGALRRSRRVRAPVARSRYDREAGDVMRAADDDRCRCRAPPPSSPRASSARSVSHGPGRRLPVPRLRRRARIDDRRLARSSPCGRFSISVEIRREQREAVRRVAEEIAGDEHVGDVARDVGAHAGALRQERGCAKVTSVACGDARFGHGGEFP